MINKFFGAKVINFWEYVDKIIVKDG